MALPAIDFTSFTVDNIRECFRNNGIYEQDIEFEVAKDGAFKYIGYNALSHCHKFLLGFLDTAEEEFYVCCINISLNSKGELIADYAGCPIFEGGSMVEIYDYINRTSR